MVTAIDSASDRIALAWRELLDALGYDLDAPHFRNTPARVARFWRDWHRAGREPPHMTTFPADAYDEVVAVRGIHFHSLCAHHGLPFYGDAAVGYLPADRIVGLSKLARVVDYHARRFQTQEALTRDIATTLEGALAPRGVAVVLRAEHLCMAMRGIERPGHRTITSVMAGVFRDKPEARAEFLNLTKGPER